MLTIKAFAYPGPEGSWVVEAPAYGLAIAQGPTVEEAMLELRRALSATIGPCQVELVPGASLGVVRRWDRALSADEMRALVEAGKKP